MPILGIFRTVIKIEPNWNSTRCKRDLLLDTNINAYKKFSQATEVITTKKVMAKIGHSTPLIYYISTRSQRRL